MTAAKPRRGRPRMASSRSVHVMIRLAPNELAAIESAVASENAGIIADGHLDEPPATVASWIRDHVLDSVGMMDVPAQR